MINWSEKLKKVDSVFRGIGIACLVFCIVMSVFAVLVWVVDISLIGEIDTTITIGSAKITPAEEYLLEGNAAKMYMFIGIVVAIVDFAFGGVFIKMFREIIKPICEGKPMENHISAGLKRISKFWLWSGAIVAILKMAFEVVTYYIYNVHELLTSEKILKCASEFKLDLSFLVVSVVILLISVLFEYTEDLQRQVDETL